MFQDKGLTYIEKAKVTPVFRSVINSGGKMETRIEKLADHLGGRSSTHPQNYIAKLKQYADLVLEEYDIPDENLESSAEAKSEKLAA